jgi:hypothetical protein
MDDLKEVMLGVFEDHEDAFVFQDNFYEPDDIHMAQFRTEGHLSDGRLRDACILNLLAFLIFGQDQYYGLKNVNC